MNKIWPVFKGINRKFQYNMTSSKREMYPEFFGFFGLVFVWGWLVCLFSPHMYFDGEQRESDILKLNGYG